MKTSTAYDVLEGRAQWAVVHGSSEEVLASLPDNSIDHVLTDPPYSVHVHGKQRRMLRGAGGRAAKGQPSGRGKIGPAELGFDALSLELRESCAVEFARICERWCLIFSDQESQHLWRDDLETAGLRHVRCGVWVKLAGMPQFSGDRPAVGHEAIQISHSKARLRWNGGGLPAVWSFSIATDRNGSGERIHTTQKPLDLMLRLVELFTDPGDLIVDPFSGSGTTGVACTRLGRRFIGIEMTKKYAVQARARIAADMRGLTLRDARRGQRSIFDVIGG